MRKENFEIVWYEQSEEIPYEQPVEYGWTKDGMFGTLLTKQRILDSVLFKFTIYDFIIINGNIYRTRDDIPKFCKELTENYYIMTEHDNLDDYGEFLGVYAEIHITDEIGIPDKNLKTLFLALSR